MRNPDMVRYLVPGMAEKSDRWIPDPIPTRLDFTEPKILDVDMDLDSFFEPERVWIWILGIMIRTRPEIQNPIQIKSCYYLDF